MSFDCRIFKYQCFTKKGRRRFYRFACLKPGTNRYSVPVRVYSSFHDSTLVKVNFTTFFTLLSSSGGGSGLTFCSDSRTKSFCFNYLKGFSFVVRLKMPIFQRAVCVWYFNEGFQLVHFSGFCLRLRRNSFLVYRIEDGAWAWFSKSSPTVLFTKVF